MNEKLKRKKEKERKFVEKWKQVNVMGIKMKKKVKKKTNNGWEKSARGRERDIEREREMQQCNWLLTNYPTISWAMCV